MNPSKNSSKFVGQPRHALDIHFHKRVGKKLDALLNAQILDEKGNVIGNVEYADGNTIFKFKSTQAAGGGTQRFKVTTTFDETSTLADYFAALQWSDSANDFSGDTIYIAKHYKQRPSITSETIFGTIVTYAYTDNQHRTTTGGGSQQEQLQPPVQVDDIIFCSKLLTPDTSITVVEDGSHPEWVDNSARLWARKLVQT